MDWTRAEWTGCDWRQGHALFGMQSQSCQLHLYEARALGEDVVLRAGEGANASSCTRLPSVLEQTDKNWGATLGDLPSSDILRSCAENGENTRRGVSRGPLTLALAQSRWLPSVDN